ncbi:fumarylacetoacetate hydrolase family protein, partial [Staphylococcus epidermidis]|uniref:fumarylacetoacetate hydrolase family protein n=1 Tax=Staphylococcus epidermidis TaxID=1282 RepID=UPI001642E403
LTQQFHYEPQLAIVIPKSPQNIPTPLALHYIYAYTIINHITHPTPQTSHHQPFLSKTLTAPSPIPPYILTKHQLPPPHNLNILTKLNNE